MSKLRTFIAVEAPEPMRARAAALIRQLSDTEANVKWVAPPNLHWTMKFLGEVEDRDVPRICEAMAEGVGGIAPFDARACRVDAFPSADRPRTVWLGVEEGSEPFVGLHDALEGPLHKLGFRGEHRRFQPHMTLGRVRRSPRGIGQLGRKIAELASYDAGSMRVQEIVLFSSLLDRQGPAYHLLGRAELAG